MTIILYDIASTIKKSCSPNSLRARFCLCYKGIPFKTEWIEYPDIKEFSKKHSIKPTAKTPWDGTDYYTLPAIHDPSTGVYLADYLVIAEYLERQYPGTPSIFPTGTIGLQSAFTDAYLSAIYPLVDLTLLPIYRILSPRSQRYYRETREMAVGSTLEDADPKDEKLLELMTTLKANLDKVDSWYAESNSKGPFMLGDTLSWVDFNVAAWNMFMKIFLGEKEWEEIRSWNGGRWSNILMSLENLVIRE